MAKPSQRDERDSVGAQTGLLYEVQGRQRKAAKIRAALSGVVSDCSALDLLDVGCASGIITRALAQHFRFAVGIDLNEDGLRITPAAESDDARPTAFVRGTTARLPFANNSFDIIICAQVYEHVADQTALAEESFRVLRPGGWMFFSGPNRLWPIEDHYKLLGLGWIPRTWANLYLRLTRRGRVFEENLLTSSQLRRLFWRFERVDITARMIKNPASFHFQTSWLTRAAAQLPEAVIQRLSWAYPNPNWLLRKPAEPGAA